MEKLRCKIAFMGNPEFAVPTLELLHQNFRVSVVVTNPDKPSGRGLKLKPTPVKIKAIELGIPILQPTKLKDSDFIRQLKEIQPDIIVVVAFKILPVEVFSLATIASFNVHPSLLPKYRGPAPINWQIINGEMITGVTTFILQEQVDSGNILLQHNYEIPDGWTAGELNDFLARRGAELAVETCNILLSGNYSLIPQDEAKATKAPKIFPEQCQIDWTKSARVLRNFIHGVSPTPGAWTLFNGKRFKIYKCHFLEDTHNYNTGRFIQLNGRLAITCSNGFIFPIQVQIEGGKIVSSDDFLRGYKVE